MKYIKDIKAILSEIGMAFSVHGYMKSTGFFCLLQRKKKQGKREKGKGKGKGKVKENWKRKKNKGNLVEEKKSERYRKLFAKHKFNEQCML